MNTAAHLREQGIALQPGSILCIVFDGDHALTHTEATLDTWWANLSPEQKAEIYEASLGPEVDTCLYCGCDDEHACPDGCSWFDADHTVCSTAGCVQRHLAVMESKRGAIPLLNPTSAVLEAAAAVLASLGKPRLVRTAKEAADASL